MKFKIIISGLVALICSVNVFAKGDEFTQSIYIVNQLATKLEDPGMTPTDLSISYFNGGASPCWKVFLSYRKDVTIHAGPTQGCKSKVNRIEIKPMVMLDKLKVYENTVNVDVDTTKFSTQITVDEDRNPLFDARTGLISTPGTLKTTTSSQFAG